MSKYPKVRKLSSEKLYEYMLEVDDSRSLSILLEVDWCGSVSSLERALVGLYSSLGLGVPLDFTSRISDSRVRERDGLNFCYSDFISSLV
jgi:hypothetical protein